jgi:hypothetical protein
MSRCDDAKRLLTRYLDALEKCDRLHLRLISAYRAGDADTAACYWGLWKETRTKVQAARDDYRDHQLRHACSEALRFDE